jgi:phosphatidate cytidylyltransferase
VERRSGDKRGSDPLFGDQGLAEEHEEVPSFEDGQTISSANGSEDHSHNPGDDQPIDSGEATQRLEVEADHDDVPVENADLAAAPSRELDEDATMELPDWRDPPSGEIPKVIEELAGGPPPSWDQARTGSLDDIEAGDLDLNSLIDRRQVPSSPQSGHRADEERLNESQIGGDPSVDDNSTTTNHLSGAELRAERSLVASKGRSKLVSSLTGLILGGAVLAAFAAGRVFALAVVVVALLAALAEMYSILRRAGAKPMTLFGMLASGFALIGAYAWGAGAISWALAALVLIMLIFYLLGFPAKPKAGTVSRRIGATVIGFSWVGVLGSFATLLLRPQDFGPSGLGLLLGTLICVVADDTFAFFTGSFLGRHLLAPRISPSKTVEGLFGGAVAAVLAGALIVSHIHPFSPVDGAFLGAVVACFEPIGDLAESALKREAGIKDSSNLLPGHGGMLDRIDGVIFVLPAVFLLFRLLKIG